jgi:L-iditol 2-dehydrogenase
MPEESCFPLYGRLSTDHGVISEPLAIGVYSVKNSVPLRNARIAVLGFGPIGMSVMLAARADGAEIIYVSDRIDSRLEVSRSEGAAKALNPDKEDIVKKITEMEPLGLDVVFECCGKQEAFNEGIDLLKPGGRMVVVGIPEFDTWSMNVEKTRRKEVTVRFIRRQVDCVESALELMDTGQIEISNMITHRFPFTSAKEAFDMVEAYAGGVMKAIIDF